MDGHTGNDKYMNTSLWIILRSFQYLKLHSVRTGGWLTNELDEIWKGSGRGLYYTGVGLEGLRKNTTLSVKQASQRRFEPGAFRIQVYSFTKLFGQ